MTDFELTPELMETMLEKLSPEAASALTQSLATVLASSSDPAARKAALLKEQFEYRQQGKHAEADAMQPIIDSLDVAIANQAGDKASNIQLQWMFVGVFALVLVIALFAFLRGL